MNEKKRDDRRDWCEILSRMALPVLTNMSQGNLRNDMMIETGPTWDKRNINIGYTECFARLMAGLSPWLSLVQGGTDEDNRRSELLNLSLSCYKNAVDPSCPDYLMWEGHPQALVECAYIAESFLKGYDVIWNSLDELTRNRYIDIFIRQRSTVPYNNNWVLFSAVIETFLNKAANAGDNYRVIQALRQIDSWYVGDGWYSDGPNFSFDYYNSFVIQPMLIECLSELDITNLDKRLFAGISNDKILKRLQRYAIITERLISPEGTFPVLGRSITYRSAFLHPLAFLAWKDKLPSALKQGQVRSAMTTVLQNLFKKQQNYNNKGYLCIGFNGHQPRIANSYTNNGSLYMASLAFLPLGLPQNHPFWTSQSEAWTSKKAWEGADFPIDHSYNEVRRGLKEQIKEKVKEKLFKH